MSETRAASRLYSLWNSTTAIITSRNPPKSEQPPNNPQAVLPSAGKYRRASSPLFWTDDTGTEKIGTGVVLTTNHEPQAQVVNLTFDSDVSSPSSLLASPDSGKSYASDIPDVEDNRDLEYVEEVQNIRDDLKDEEMAVETATANCSLRPRMGMSRIVATRPISWPLAMPSSTKKVAALDLTLERECTGCFDPFEPLTGLHASCGHHYCLPCVHNMVTASVSDEGLFPPKCCNQPLTTPFTTSKDNNEGGFEQIKLLGLVLDDRALKEKMEGRWLEWSVKGEERVYCSNSSCAVFLGSASEFNVGNQSHLGSKESGPSDCIAYCRACPASTCVSCRQSAHAGKTCADSGEALFWGMVKVKRWRQCPTCSVVIEKDGGCNIMKCPCGNKFTYEIE